MDLNIALGEIVGYRCIIFPGFSLLFSQPFKYIVFKTVEMMLKS